MEVAALVVAIISLLASLGIGIGVAWYGTAETRSQRRADYRYQTAVELIDLLIILRSALAKKEWMQVDGPITEYNDAGDIISGSAIPVPPALVSETVPRVVARAASLGANAALDIHWGLFEWDAAVAEAQQAPDDPEAINAALEWPRALTNAVHKAIGEARDIVIAAGKAITGTADDGS